VTCETSSSVAPCTCRWLSTDLFHSDAHGIDIRFLPFYAGAQLLAIESDLDSPEILAVALTRPQSGLVFAGYAVLAWGLGVIALHRRAID